MTKDRGAKKSLARKENIREERNLVSAIKEFLSFNFRYLDETQPNHAPETISLWQSEGLLESFIIRLKELSQLTKDEAVKQQQIKVYNTFPPKDKTDFFHPKHVAQDVAWAVIKHVGSQKGVVAGFILENIFYVV